MTLQPLRADAPMLAALIPYNIGYQPDEHCVAIVGIDANSRVVGTAVSRWDGEQSADPDLARKVAHEIYTKMAAASVQRYIVAGYGPRGVIRANLLANALILREDAEIYDVWHVQDGQVRVLGPRGWGRPRLIPEAAPEAITLGIAPPSQSRDAALDRLAPHPDPYPPLDAGSLRRLTVMRPSERVTHACRLIADHAQHTTTSHPRSEEAEIVTILRSNRTVRDAVITWATDARARMDYLVELSRRAPTGDREAVATIAATALLLAGGSSWIARELLDRGDTTAEQSTLTQLARTLEHLGVAPAHTHAERDDQAITRALARADRDFLAKTEPDIPGPAALCTTDATIHQRPYISG